MINFIIFQNGFFVEAGAADCEFSETLPLEKHYNWTGVLIEAVPSYFQECKEVGRWADLPKNNFHLIYFSLKGG